MLEKIISDAEKLCEFSPRLWENEGKAANYVQKILEQKDIDYQVQKYDVTYPKFPEYRLVVDGEKIQCLPSGLESGEINDKVLVDSINVPGRDSDLATKSNINFNPYCEGVSKPRFYQAPSLSISRSDVSKVLEADNIEGYMKVEWEEFVSRNFLIGNLEDPEKIVFTHYDSWWGGFIDNAFSVSALINLLPSIDLDDMLVVIAGSEEVSHEQLYWCYGYRVFEREYTDILEDCRRITVVDGIGRGETEIRTDNDRIREAFLLEDESLLEKSVQISSQRDVEIIHSPVDTSDKLTHGKEAIEKLREKLT